MLGLALPTQLGGGRVDTGNGAGLLRLVGNRELEDQRVASEEAQRRASEVVISSLASHIKTAWQAAVSAKKSNGIEERLHECLRQRKGEYDAATQAQINEFEGSSVYVMLTDNTCRAAKAWLRDIMLPAGERPWSLRPTPVPNLPDEIEAKIHSDATNAYLQAVRQRAVMGIGMDASLSLPDILEQAKRKAKQLLKDKAAKDTEEMEEYVDDQLVEGGYYEAIDGVIDDLVTFPTAFIEGPIVRKKRVLDWAPVPNMPGYQTAQVIEKITREWERASPFDMYFAPGAKNSNEGYAIRLNRWTRRHLTDLLGVPGFNDAEIRKALQAYGEAGYKIFEADDTVRRTLEDRGSVDASVHHLIDVLKFWGSVQGSKLLDWGMDKATIPDPEQEYEVEAWMVGSYVIGARLNKHPLGWRPIRYASFVTVSDSIWGRSPPELMKDIQKICNSAARAMVDNMGYASGPQVYVWEDLLPPGQTANRMWPRKIWVMNSNNRPVESRKPIEFDQPQVIIKDLLELYDYFFKMGSEVTGIPAYVYGSDQLKQGAASTASGLSMLMNAASKGLKSVIYNVDTGIIKPSIKDQWLHIVLYEPDKAKGDVQVVARASEHLIMQEQIQVRRKEALDSTANQFDMAIIGTTGRAEMLRDYMKGLKFDASKIVPDREDMIGQESQQQIMTMVQNIAVTLGVPPAVVLQAAQGGGIPPRAPGAAPGALPPPSRTLDSAGNNPGGVDYRLMQ